MVQSGGVVSGGGGRGGGSHSYAQTKLHVALRGRIGRCRDVRNTITMRTSYSGISTEHIHERVIPPRNGPYSHRCPDCPVPSRVRSHPPAEANPGALG